MMDSVGTTDPGVVDDDPLAVPGIVPVARDGRREAAEVGETPGEAWLKGTAWQIGGEADVLWIAANTRPGISITSAIPPIFNAYATLVVPGDDERKQLTDNALLSSLRAHSADQPWWLGYLETGPSDVVFPDARRVRLYAEWPYVLVKAGPDQAARWRTNHGALPWHSAMPELMFPQDQSWLVSTLWDDDWRCVGGPISLVEALLEHPQLEARTVGLDEAAAPPGHQSQ